MRRVIGLLLAALVMLPGFVAAQDAPATIPGVTQQDDVGGDLQKTWGEKRKIRTLQRRLFNKFGRMEFTFFAGIVPNDPFVFYTPVGLRFDYHFNESFAVEASGSFLGCFGSDVGDGFERGYQQGCLRLASDLKADLQGNDRIQVRTIKLLDQQVTREDVLAMWSPIFGKVAALDQYLVHFDVNVVGGAGYLMTERFDVANPRVIKYRHTFEGVVGAGFKFYFGTRYAVRADFRQYVYVKQNESGSANGTANPSEITLGFSVFTD